jgi:uncharacterized protein
MGRLACLPGCDVEIVIEMLYNVAQLLKGPTGGERRYHLSQDIKALDPDLQTVQPIEGWIRLMRTSQGILASGTLRTVLQMECSRCLEPCEVEVEIELEEEFRPTVPISDAPVDIVPEEEWDDALVIDEHHILDLREVIRQGIWLAAPMEALCRVDCAGLCPHCGGNRNLGECTCEEPAIDPRWAALQSLLTTESESDERSN